MQIDHQDIIDRMHLSVEHWEEVLTSRGFIKALEECPVYKEFVLNDRRRHERVDFEYIHQIWYEPKTGAVATVSKSPSSSAWGDITFQVETQDGAEPYISDSSSYSPYRLKGEENTYMVHTTLPYAHLIWEQLDAREDITYRNEWVQDSLETLSYIAGIKPIRYPAMKEDEYFTWSLEMISYKSPPSEDWETYKIAETHQIHIPTFDQGRTYERLPQGVKSIIGQQKSVTEALQEYSRGRHVGVELNGVEHPEPSLDYEDFGYRGYEKYFEGYDDFDKGLGKQYDKKYK